MGEDAILFLKIGDDLLLMTLNPACEYGDQGMQNHRRSSSLKSYRNRAMQYVDNLRNTNEVELAEFFNTTQYAPAAL
jgi:hypothetical protein